MSLRTLAPVLFLAGVAGFAAPAPADATVQRTVMIEEFGFFT